LVLLRLIWYDKGLEVFRVIRSCEEMSFLMYYGSSVDAEAYVVVAR
jgi:hypothetical protein